MSDKPDRQITISHQCGIFEEGEIICTRHVDNGFWKLLWHWILQKNIDRGDFFVISKIVSSTEIELEGNTNE